MTKGALPRRGWSLRLHAFGFRLRPAALTVGIHLRWGGRPASPGPIHEDRVAEKGKANNEKGIDSFFRENAHPFGCAWK
jgi:hypothetical protein